MIRGGARNGLAVDSLWTALAMVLIIEGILPFLSPATWREAFRRIIELSDGQLRFMGLVAILLGLACLVAF